MKQLFLILLAFAATLWDAWLFAAARQSIQGEKMTGHTLFRLSDQAMLPVMFVSNAAVGLFLAGYYKLGTVDILRTLLILGVLWACAWADARAFLIPNRVVAMGAAAGVLVLLVEILRNPGTALYQAINVVAAAVAMLVASLLCRIISPKSIGMGDVKLLAVMGICLGMGLVWSAVFCSLIVLFCYCCFLLLTKRAAKSDSVPLAPFLLLGTLVAAFITGI